VEYFKTEMQKQTFRECVEFISLLLGRFAYSRKAPIAFVMSVRLCASITAACTRRISEKFYVWDFYEKP